MNGGKSEARNGPQPLQVEARTPAAFALQRKCACGGGAAGALTGRCDDCEGKKLQRSAAGPVPDAVPGIVGEVLATAGAPLGSKTRHDMESHFGQDFGSVRIHTDAPAAESARSVGALAYTVGSHVVFGANQYAPETHTGRHLLAHELTHTVQQRGVVALQRQPAVSEPGDAAEVEADRVADRVAGALLVEDDAQPAPSQMRKTEFLDELQRSSCIAADEELARVGRSTEGCPYIERAFARYRTMPAARVERSIRRYIDAAGVTGARDYIPLVTRRVAEGVSRWATTGDMSGVPPELAADAMGGGGGILGMLGGGLAGLVGGLGRLLFKREGGGNATPAEAAMVSSGLGGGAPLDSGVRGRMESAFGYDFSRVRVHAGSNAGSVSSSLGARAFTLGGDIGFAAGEYQPNTLVGDALIAHELAHVVQQSGGGNASSDVEEDADFSAVGAVMSVWGGAKQIARSAMPRLRSGLRLQRCSAPSEFPWQGIIIRETEVHAAVPTPPAPTAAPATTTTPAPAAEETATTPAAATPAAATPAAATPAAAAPAVQILATLSNGTRVKVLERSGTYLKVETKSGKQTTTGWVEATAVDDVVAHEMQGMVERKQEALWQPSGGKLEGGTGNTFQKWAEADAERDLPPLGPETSINCWEMILYAAFKTGVIGWRTIHDMYMTDPLNMWPTRLVRSRKEYVPGTPLRRGNLVFFDDMDHVALATGNKDEVYTFWPPPDTPFSVNPPYQATLDRVKISTVSALVAYMTANDKKKRAPTVEQGQPQW